MKNVLTGGWFALKKQSFEGESYCVSVCVCDH